MIYEKKTEIRGADFRPRYNIVDSHLHFLDFYAGIGRPDGPDRSNGRKRCFRGDTLRNANGKEVGLKPVDNELL